MISLSFRVSLGLGAMLALGLLLGGGHAQAVDRTCAELQAHGIELAGARDSNPAEGVEQGEAALRAAESMHPRCPVGEAMLLGGIATNLGVLGRQAEAGQHFERALEVLGSAGAPAQRAFLHRGLGVVLAAESSYKDALEHYLSALSASQQAGDVAESAKTAANIGILYTELGDFAKARAYQQRALAGFEAADSKPGIAGTLVNLGAVAAKLGQHAGEAGDLATAAREHEELLQTNRRALELFAELGNERGVAYAESNIGLALDRSGRPQQALDHHQHSLTIRRAVGDKGGTINSLLSVASTQTSLQRYAEAAAALDEALTLIPEGDYSLLSEAAERRVALAEAQGDHRTALEAQREVTRVLGLQAEADQLARVTALQDRFDADHAERQIALLETEARVDELKLQRQRLLTRLSLLVAALAIGFFLMLLSRYRMGVTSARQLAIAAMTDPLTGLANRRHMLELMQAEAARGNRGGGPFCLLMTDLDEFKVINDRFGHDAGDAVLRETAIRLRDALRRDDTVARWGGEEFLILLPVCDRDGAVTLADKLRQCIAGEPFLVGPERQALTVTLTVGIGQFQPGMALEDCIKAADLALYQGKQLGKNRTELSRMPQQHATPPAPCA
ncbi:MAG: diguanylate cyclase [Xanthomonadales bacterium]|nr:diguanylate cyclase [Xanthomonadales bacterium]